MSAGQIAAVTLQKFSCTFRRQFLFLRSEQGGKVKKILQNIISILLTAMRGSITAAVLLCVLISGALFPTRVRAIGFDAEKTYDSVFVIYADRSLGSGFSHGKDLVITNAHVVADADKITVVNYHGDEFKANISAFDEELDIAALWVEHADFPLLTVADYDDCKIGEDVYAIGTPNSMDYTLTKGVLSAKDRRLGPNLYLQIDAAINSGNSGGPLLNDNGQVIGVNTLKITNSEGIGLAVPMTTVAAFLERSGIVIDNEGNVSGLTKEPYIQTEEIKPKPFSQSPDAQSRQANPQITLLIILLVISMAANGFLALLLIRRKIMDHKPNPSERTDFEIEFLE